jgi:DNA-binding MarR family transcriptional regulator
VRGVTRRDDLREIDRALLRITRIGKGRAAARLRSERSGVELSRTGVAILAALASHGGLRPTALAEAADAEAAIITREIRVLSALGYLESRTDPSDGRARIVEITADGRAAFGRYRDAIDSIIADTFSSWTGADLATLRRLLQRVADDFAHPSPPAERGSTNGTNPGQSRRDHWRR